MRDGHAASRGRHRRHLQPALPIDDRRLRSLPATLTLSKVQRRDETQAGEEGKRTHPMDCKGTD